MSTSIDTINSSLANEINSNYTSLTIASKLSIPNAVQTYSNTTFTTNSAGLHLILLTAQFNSTSGNGSRFARIEPTSTSGENFEIASISGKYIKSQVFTIRSLKENEVVKFCFNQNSGGEITVDAWVIAIRLK